MLVQHDLQLMFPTDTVTRPIFAEVARGHDVVFNILSANVSQNQGHFHYQLIGEEAQVIAAEEHFKRSGVEVSLTHSQPYTGSLPQRPAREPVKPGDPVESRKLWLTILDPSRAKPLLWEMMARYDVIFDLRQSSTGQTVSIMAVLLKGPAGHVEAAIRFLESHGVEVEPIEKSVVEG